MKLFRKNKNLNDVHKQAIDWNGYEREKAVKELGNIGSISSIPILLKRVNDWVPQVREAAKKSLLMLTTPHNSEAFVIHLPNLFHLRDCRRWEHEALIDEVVSYLLDAENQKIVILNINNSNREIARICLSLSIENKLDSSENLIRRAFKHQDVIVRSMAFDLFKSSLEDLPIELIEMAKKDPFMPIRREILRILWEASNDTEIVKGFLFDKHASVRILANWLLDQHGHRCQAENEYINELHLNKFVHKLRSAIWGIGHLKLVQFENQVSLHLDSKYSSVRRQALLSLIKLDVKDAEKIVEKCLGDQSRSIRKLSLHLHEVLQLSYGVNELLLLLKNARDKEHRKSCFDVSRLSSRWDRLILSLSLLDAKYSGLFDDGFILDSIQNWCADSNRVAASPTSKQAIQLKEIIRRNPDYLDLDRGLPFLFKTFGIIGNA